MKKAYVKGFEDNYISDKNGYTYKRVVVDMDDLRKAFKENGIKITKMTKEDYGCPLRFVTYRKALKDGYFSKQMWDNFTLYLRLNYDLTIIAYAADKNVEE